jgi:tetratricopeptide (TPR) repeat protein
LRASIAQRRASIALRRGAHDDAAATALEAMALAAEAQDDGMLATLALDYAEILTDQGRLDELRQHLRYAELAVTRAGDHPAQRARLEFERGRFHEIALEPEASLQAHRRALELRREHLPGSLYEADSHVNVAALSGNLGHLDEALAEIDAGLQLYRTHLGEVHPTIAHACVIRGHTQQRMGQLDAAAETLDGCIAMLETTLGPDAEKIAFASTLLGMLHAHRGDYLAARTAFERAVEIRIARLGPDHPETGVAHANLGNVLAAMRESDAARSHLERARAITVTVHGEDSPRLSTILSGLGQIAANEGDYATAQGHYAQSLAIAETAEGAGNPSLVTNLINLAEVQSHLRDSGARATYARAEAILLEAGLESHPLEPLIDVGIGRAMIDAGEIDQALARLDAAVRATESTEVTPGLHAGARFARARAWAVDPERRHEAVDEARLARQRIPEGADPALVTEIDAWLDRTQRRP